MFVVDLKFNTGFLLRDVTLLIKMRHYMLQNLALSDFVINMIRWYR